MIRWLRKLLRREGDKGLNFDGDGRVSASVEDIMNSDNFKRQLKAVRELAEGHQQRSVTDGQ